MNQKVLWAVDAFPEAVELQIKTAKLVRPIVEAIASTIEPVSVLKPAPPGVFVIEPPELGVSVKLAARKNIDRIVAEVGMSRVGTPTLLRAPYPSHGSLVQTLLKYAIKENFDLIVVGSHARKGIPRFVSGSFTERLILESPLPVLVTNPKTTAPLKAVRNILFPTDFSPASREAFESILGLAAEMKVGVILYHQLESQRPELGYPFIIPTLVVEAIETSRLLKKEEAKQWMARAHARGVRSSFHLANFSEDVSVGIVRLAKKVPGCLIALVSQTNQAQAILLGSVARRVLRSAGSPVYIFHSRKRQAQRRAQWIPVPAVASRAVLT